jgi:hypothetical protein
VAYLYVSQNVGTLNVRWINVSIRSLQTTVISSEDQLDQTLRRPHDLGPWAVLKNPRPTSASMPCWLAVLARSYRPSLPRGWSRHRTGEGGPRSP